MESETVSAKSKIKAKKRVLNFFFFKGPFLFCEFGAAVWERERKREREKEKRDRGN